jgi:hypothetical protein
MFINVNNSNVRPKLLDQVNDTAIILYGHYGKRYDERVKRLQEVFDINNLRYRKVLLKTMDAIKDNYDKVITKDGNPVRTLVRDNVRVKVLSQIFDIEVNVLVKSTIVDWHDEYPLKVVEGYEDLLEKGIIKLGEPVICIETIISTVKCVDDDEEYGLIDMENMEVIGSLNLSRFTCYKVDMEDFDYITEYLMDKRNGRTDNAADAYELLKIRFA